MVFTIGAERGQVVFGNENSPSSTLQLYNTKHRSLISSTIVISLYSSSVLAPIFDDITPFLS